MHGVVVLFILPSDTGWLCFPCSGRSLCNPTGRPIARVPEGFVAMVTKLELASATLNTPLPLIRPDQYRPRLVVHGQLIRLGVEVEDGQRPGGRGQD